VRLLVTRPEPEANPLAARLRANGYDVLVAPLTRIVLAAEPAGLPKPAAIAVTSRNGARSVASWSAATSWKGATIYAVGAATAAEARMGGFSDVRTASGDVEALADLIGRDFDPTAGPLLYAAARDRSADLAALLPDVRVVTVEAYAAEAVPRLNPEVVEALRDGTLDGVLLFSSRAAQILVDLATATGVREALAKPAMYALSKQVAQPLRAVSGARVLVAAHPNEGSLLALVNPALAQSS